MADDKPGNWKARMVSPPWPEALENVTLQIVTTPFHPDMKGKLRSDFHNHCALCLKKCTCHGSHAAHLYEQSKLGAKIVSYTLILPAPSSSLYDHFFAIGSGCNHGWPPSRRLCP